MFRATYSDETRTTTVYGDNPESVQRLAQSTPDKLIAEFNTYVNDLFKLLDYIKDEEKREELSEELDDSLESYATKAFNKQVTINLLRTHVTEVEKFDADFADI